MNNNEIVSKYKELKKQSGSHSPSLSNIKEKISEIKIKVDACFLSNPYATNLFLKYFKKELIETGDINSLLEFYPSQNNIIAGYIESQLQLDKGHVFVSNGAIEAIQAVIHRFTKGKILVIIPTFSSYYEYATSENEVIYYKLKKENNFELDIEDYINTVREVRPNTIILINPNNPDGGYIKSRDLERIISELAWLENIVIDESFIHFAYENSEMKLQSVVPYAKGKKNVVVLKSMSKDFGIAGLRCGYAIMAKEKVNDLLTNGYLWNSNGLAEYFFKLYSRKDFLIEYEVVRRKYINESLLFISDLKEISNIKTYPTRANFVLIELLNGLTADDVSTDLICNHGIYVRNCNDKIGLEGEFIRIAARSKEENKLIVNAINNVTVI